MKDLPIEGQGGLLALVEAGATSGFVRPKQSARALRELLRRLCVESGLIDPPPVVAEPPPVVTEPTPVVTEPPPPVVTTPDPDTVFTMTAEDED